MTPKTEAPPARLPADAPLDDRLFGAVFEHGADGVLVSRPDGAILRANPAACRMLGRSEEELRRLGRGGFVVDDAARARSSPPARRTASRTASSSTGGPTAPPTRRR